MRGKKAKALRKKFKEPSYIDSCLTEKGNVILKWRGGKRQYRDAKKEARHG